MKVAELISILEKAYAAFDWDHDMRTYLQILYNAKVIDRDQFEDGICADQFYDSSLLYFAIQILKKVTKL